MKMSKGLIGRHLLGLAMVGLVLAVGGTAHAELGQPAPWEYTLQESATEVMDFIRQFHNWLLAIITAVTLFVLALLIIVVVTMDFMAQVQNYLMSQQYESLLKKANFKTSLGG